MSFKLWGLAAICVLSACFSTEIGEENNSSSSSELLFSSDLVSSGALASSEPLLSSEGSSFPALSSLQGEMSSSLVLISSSSLGVAKSSTDASYYDTDYRYLDEMGTRGGSKSGRILDSFEGETQIQIAIGSTPTGTWSGNLSQTRSDNAKGPMYWMSLAAVQELLNMDMQYLMAIALKETGAGSGMSPRMSNAEGAYGAFEGEAYSVVSRMLTYPKFYPKHAACLKSSADAVSIISCEGDQATSIVEPIYGGGTSDINGSEMVNSAFIFALHYREYYDLLTTATDFCEWEAPSVADPYLGLCAISGHYNLGINGGVPTALKSKSTLSDVNGCDALPQGNSNYTARVRQAVSAIVKDQSLAQTDLKIPLVDKKIDLETVHHFFWGKDGDQTGNGSNGLMWHFDIGSQRASLWKDVKTKFEELSSHWGDGTISFRYDWLSLLRVAKPYLDLSIPNPQGEAVNRYIQSHSAGTACR